MTPPTVREQSRAADRERALDRVMSAPGADARRSETIAAIDQLGDFHVEVEGVRGRTPLSTQVGRWNRAGRVPARDTVRAAAVVDISGTTSC